MEKESFINRIIKDLREAIRSFPDKRTGKNNQYDMVDAGMGAFSVFFIQCASFLEYQREIKLAKGHCNAESLFELESIPSDNQIRNLLDGVSPASLDPAFQRIFMSLESQGVLEKFRSYADHLLIAMDGTEYFSSQSMQCTNWNQRTLKNGKISYFHSVITPVVVQAGNEHVISLEPEYIVPQDGEEKQDCETRASRRWLEKHGSFYAKRKAIVLGDDLYSRQPFCEALKDQGFHFILVCKPDSHGILYETAEFLAGNNLLGTKSVRLWNGKYGEIWTYRYANKLPLRADEAAMEVNWCEISIVREDTGSQIYKNGFITDFEVSDANVEAIVRDGRARWKVENEHNNVLKTKGYHLEHNFGHGSQFLASLLLSFNLLAFLFHTVLDLGDEKYRAIRKVLVRRRTFFRDLEALLRYFSFNTWEEVITFMFVGLELDSG